MIVLELDRDASPRSPQPGESLNIRGSVLLAQAESYEEVLQALRKDICYTSGVWDLEKAQIYPVSYTSQ